MSTFEQLGLSKTMLDALKRKGFEECTPIQAEVIPLLLQDRKDIIGQAQTGTGKTAAFGLPLIEKINEKPYEPQALILTPTRELALQVADELNSFKGNKRLNIVPIYGGQSMGEQLRRLKQGAHIIVGTPGRVIDHLDRGSLKLDSLYYFVLDEADEMLNMGFIDDVEAILKNTPDHKRILMFSATMPKRLMQIAERYMGEKQTISVKSAQLTTELTEQIYFEVLESNKFEALCRIVDIETEFYGMIFCRTKLDVDNVAKHLYSRGYAAMGLHGDITQGQREKILHQFKDKRINILVATDVAARGIDIHNLTHVINYSLPQNPESYVHRIGRTGRAGQQGTAITFVTPEEYRRLVMIKRITKSDIRKERLPKVADIIKNKVVKVQNDLRHIIESSNYQTYAQLADELLHEHKDPKAVVASVLKYALKQQLETTHYREIQEVSPVEQHGKTRLFVARGRADGMTPRKLIQFLQEQVRADDLKILDIEIFDRFSFINTPFEDAEILLESFKTKRGKPIVTRAKQREQVGGRSVTRV